MPEYLTVKEAAKLLGYDRYTIQRQAAKGKIPCIKIGNATVRIPKEWVNEQLRRAGVFPAASQPVSRTTPEIASSALQNGQESPSNPAQEVEMPKAPQKPTEPAQRTEVKARPVPFQPKAEKVQKAAGQEPKPKEKSREKESDDFLNFMESDSW